ncbi:Zonular occludens toxin [Burkholderia sp. Bp9143]|uniref:zonular occludens toxin domain-containing protein n=1 Tax=Burkholderia sp. Bp9143 TaxID=2184574 RepID=UPI000F5B85AA|nr:zonular occludens toxin domain-containing protein [Burkholderia sp. Bp9143]RQR33864.1 Zonular occludens toxin [Burkholderia sp. Bp9143]
MAINAYCGIMGSGKSYEVVSGPLLDAVAIGRRVVTNIDGVNEDAIHAYLADRRKLDVSRLGQIVHVTTDRVLEPGFFPIEVESTGGAVVTPGVVEAGDLVVIDEAWKLWAAGEKIPKEHIAFFRMHRHFVHLETKVACDVVVMVQSIGDVHRMLRPVFELTFVMHKLKSVGRPNSYRVEQYDGWKQNAKTRTGTYIKSYKSEIFPLYKSYAGGTGNEAVVDRRQNIFSNRTLWVYAALLVMVVALSVWAGWRFFHPKVSTARAAEKTKADDTHVPAPSAGATPASPTNKVVDISETWRVLGRVEWDSVQYVVLADSSGRMRVDSPSAYNGMGVATVGRVDGQRVAMWSGGRSGGPSLALGGAVK